MAAALIIAETWRSSRSQNKRKEGVDDRIDELETRVGNLVALMEAMGEQMESIRKDMQVENARYVSALPVHNYLSYIHPGTETRKSPVFY